MKLVLGSLLLSVIILGIYWYSQKIPLIRDVQNCYEVTYRVYNQKGIFSRRAYEREESICAEKEKRIRAGMTCFEKVDYSSAYSSVELEAIQKIARFFARGNEDMVTVIMEHNKVCNYPHTTIDYEPPRTSRTL